jgi:hypothetical protein
MPSYDDIMTDDMFNRHRELQNDERSTRERRPTRTPDASTATRTVGTTAIYGRRKVINDIVRAPYELRKDADVTLLVWPEGIALLPNSEGKKGNKRLVFGPEQTFHDDRSGITTLAESSTADERWYVEPLETDVTEKEALAIRIADHLLPGDRDDDYYSKADVWSAKQPGVPKLNVEDMYR